MDELRDQINDLMNQGYNCSQIMLILSLEMRGVENPELIRAMAGLANGLFAQRTCGTLTGGACLISSYAAAEPYESPKFPYKELIKNFVLWFENEYGSTECKDLVGGDRKVMYEFCPELIGKCYGKCMEMLTAMDVDVYE